MRTTSGIELGFDLRGNLKPDIKVELTFEEFQVAFLTPFKHVETSRRRIFEDYLNFLEDFKTLVTADFSQWVNGSFISKKQNPNDIDFVTLIDFNVYEAKEELIESQFRRQGAKLIYPTVDAYVVKYFPELHERHWVTDFDLVYWLDSFGKTQKNRAGQRFPKGFVEINFGNFK
jgi:hypothetical protein